MENTPKRSKALLITIIAIIFFLVVGYLIYSNRDVFGVKTSNSIAKIFSPLIPSNNSKNLNKIDQNAEKVIAQAGEDLKEGDAVAVSGDSGTNNSLIVVKTKDNNNVYGYANQDINNGDLGEITLNKGGSNSFWDSFSGFLGDIFDNGNPQNSCTNGADNFPLCNTAKGLCLNGSTNPPECTNETTGICTNGATNPPECTITQTNECINGADNPPVCTTKGGSCVNGSTNPPECTEVPSNICTNGATNPPECTTGGKPDLTITGNVTPISTTINTKTTLSSMVVNNGGASTGHSFSSYFSIESIDKNTIIVAVVPTLEAKIGSAVTASYSFPAVGEYSVRVCADKNSPSDTGTVTESNEDNNCGPATIIKIENSLPTTGDLPQCGDAIDNDGDGKIDRLDPNCHIEGDITKTYVPEHNSEVNSPVNPTEGTPQCSDTVDNDGDGKIDRLDPNCHTDSDLSKEYTPEHYSETISPVSVKNECLLIDKNPLVFTDAEKSELEELLRKFYLIAPNLKTQDDINLAYSEITQYQNFSEHLSVLINQCYDEGINRNGVVNPSYKGPTTRWGNPWYKYSQAKFRGSYVGSNFDCKYVSGYFSGTAADGKDCDIYNKSMYSVTPASCTKALRPDAKSSSQQNLAYAAGLRNKCTWNTGSYVLDIERIVNVW